jgi:hypothetical protein
VNDIMRAFDHQRKLFDQHMCRYAVLSLARFLLKGSNISYNRVLSFLGDEEDIGRSLQTGLID